MGKIDMGIIYGKLYNSQTRTFLIRTGEKFIDETGHCLSLAMIMMSLGGIQQLCGHKFAIFDPPLPCVDSFYTLGVDKNRHFLTPFPNLVHVVIE